jgi:hypothetical protein
VNWGVKSLVGCSDGKSKLENVCFEVVGAGVVQQPARSKVVAARIGALVQFMAYSIVIS